MGFSESREITIEATPDEILAVLHDLESLPEWSSAHQIVEILERDDMGRPSRSRQVVRIVGVDEDQVLAHSVHDDGVSWTLVKGQAQRAHHARYRLTPQGDSTRVHFDLSVELVLPVPNFFMKKGAQGLMEMSTEGLRRRVLAVKKGR